MIIENYSLEEQKILKECLSNIHNIHLFEKVAFLSNTGEYQLNNDSETSKKIDIIHHNLRGHPELLKDMLENVFEVIIKNLDIYKPVKYWRRSTRCWPQPGAISSTFSPRRSG